MTAGSSKRKTSSWDPHTRWLTDPYKDIFELFAKVSEMPGLAFTQGKAPWKDFFSSWKLLFTAPLPNSHPAVRGIEDLLELSKPWQENFMNIQQAWISILETAAAGNPSPEGVGGKDAKNALNAWMKSCGELTIIWLRFADDQSKAFTRFWEATQTERKALDKKGSKKSEERKTQQ